ncbi:MAG: hypothetical protein JXO48_12055 [Deltaproteobacteria bacterium]|nr:hypothetical protein [Deltaproteobacteria bacterium]
MKKTIFLLCAFIMMTTTAAASTYTVVVQEVAFRKENRFFAPAIAWIPYGEKIESTEQKGDWLNVTYNEQRGWIHIGAVNELKVPWTALMGGRADEATRDEVALAGKGFTKEVQEAFQKENPNMRYDLVDHVESLEVSRERLEKFIKDGNLKGPGEDR